MNRTLGIPFTLLALAAASLALPGRVHGESSQQAAQHSRASTSHLQPTYAASLNATPRGFIPNVGQLPDPAIKFVLRNGGNSAYFTDQGFVLWTGHTTTVPRDGTGIQLPVAPRWSLVGAQPTHPLGGDELGHTLSFFRGADPARWRTGVPAYGDLRYREILEGVEMRIAGREHGFEYSFHVQPHAQPELRFRYDGIARLEQSLDGDLIVHTAVGHFTESRPVSYQIIEGTRREVASAFEVISASEYRIAIGAYDQRHELVIDPVLDWSTSIGGSFGEQFNVIQVDGAGDVVVAGWSWSVDLPVEPGFAPFGTGPGDNLGSDPNWPEFTDVYIAKLSADGTQLRWAGYLGGNGEGTDVVGRNKALAVDAAGDLYVAAYTWSPDFPVLPLGSSAFSGNSDAAFTKISSDGSAILWSRLMGGTDEDWGYALALDPNQNLYVSGTTRSADFPATLRAFGGIQDDFAARLDAGSGAVLWNSFLGGSQEERVAAIVADATGVIVFGDTDSADFHSAGFPAPVGEHDRSLDGNNDSFITKFAADGLSIEWSTFLGGSAAETGHPAPNTTFSTTSGRADITLDNTGNIVVVGQTYSSDFPGTTASSFQPQRAGNNDAYVAKLSPDASDLIWASYLGGSGQADAEGREELASAVAVNPWDEIFIGGWTMSASPTFPFTPDALKGTKPADGFYDGFLTKVNPAGTAVQYSTYVGNDGWNDPVLGVEYAVGNVLLCGWHLDTWFQITAGAFRQECDDCGGETFLMKFLDAFIAHDGFDSGNYSGGQGDWAGNWTASGDASILTSSGPHSGSRHVRLRSSTGYLQRTINVPPGSITLQLGFWAKVNSFESSDQALVLAKSTGANFTTVTNLTSAHSNNTYRYYESDLTSFLPATQIHIAFGAMMNASNDNLYLDDIRLTGTAGSVPPIANAGPDQSVSDGDNNGVQTVTLNGSASSDPDGGAMVNYEWKEGTTVLGTGASLAVDLSLGVHTIILTVTDDETDTGIDTVQITVNPNQAPVANAGVDQTVTDSDNSGAEAVTLNGTASSDPDGSIVSYEWKEGVTVLGTGASLNTSLSVGVHTITLTVTDNGGATASDTVQVTVNPFVASIEVFYDSFEVSEWNGLWTEDSQNDWFRSTQRATQGTRSAEVDGNASDASLTSIAINLQGRTSATITFNWFIESGLDSGEYVEFRVSTNGGSTWTQKAILRGNVDPENSWRSVTVEMPGISQLSLQFRGKMNQDDEDANVDNVRVVAQ